jgi:hypothetical protein
MLTELYIEALLVDECLADEVWDLWNAGVLADDLAAWAWRRITVCTDCCRNTNPRG